MIARILKACLRWLWPYGAEAHDSSERAMGDVDERAAMPDAPTPGFHLAARLHSAAKLNRRKSAGRLAARPERAGRPKLVVQRKQHSPVETRHVWLRTRHAERPPAPAHLEGATVVTLRRPQHGAAAMPVHRRAA